MLLQFGTQSSDRTAAARQPLAVLDLDLYELAQPFSGRVCFVELLQQPLESRKAQLDDGVANLVLRLEVVVDVAQRNSGLLGDVGDRRGCAGPQRRGGLSRRFR